MITGHGRVLLSTIYAGGLRRCDTRGSWEGAARSPIVEVIRSLRFRSGSTSSA
jgi:hypothetical protein